MSGKKFQTFIPGIDNRLEGGLPQGSVILLVSDSETCLRIFSQQVPFNIASNGGKVFYFSIMKDPQYIREEMDVYNWDVQKFEKKEKWIFVDAYTQKADTILQTKEVKPIFSSLTLMRSDVLSKLTEGDVVVIDSLSDLFLSETSKSVIELLEIVSAWIRKINGLAIIPLMNEMHSERIRAVTSHIADVVLEFIVGEARFEGRIIVWKVRRARVEPLFIPFSITGSGIVAETFKRVI